MIQFGNEDISGWAGRIDTLISHMSYSVVERVVVVESTESTQDAALRLANGMSGLLLVASEQKNGRGSLGRRWYDGDRATLPCTFVVDPGFKDAPMLSACVACAVHEALARMLPQRVKLGIKWPNDIVVSTKQGEKKLAGILIEQREGLTLVGIGINCYQADHEWPAEFHDNAISLLGLGADITRFDVVSRLIESISEWFEACDRETVRQYYENFNAMIGTTRTFRYKNETFTGTVTHMDPLISITLRTSGGLKTLPIAQTEHVRASYADQPKS